jgi:hypothetical protein
MFKTEEGGDGESMDSEETSLCSVLFIMKGKADGSTRLTYTGLCGGLENLLIVLPKDDFLTSE